MLSQDILPIIAIFIGSIVAITAILSSTISKHRLQVERIRADAMVRSEEVRSRNQLELEKLMRQDRENAGGYAAGGYGQTGTAGTMGTNPAGGSAWNGGERNSAPRNDSAAYGDENFNTRSRVRE